MSLSEWLQSVNVVAARNLPARKMVRRLTGTARNGHPVRCLGPIVVERLEGRVLLSAAPVFFNAQQTFASGADPQSVAVADFVGDGNADLVAANFADNTLSFFLGNGNGTFLPQQTLATGNGPDSVAVGDLNGDGQPDIVVANRNDNVVSVFLSAGGGQFNQQTFATGTAPSAITVADLNGDGRLDLIVANAGGNSISVLLGNGDGTFQAQQTYAAGPAPHSVAAGDFNGDGKLDLAVIGPGGDALLVLPGAGNGTFGSPIVTNLPLPADSVTAADVNGDGKLDVVLANSSSNSVGVLLGNGNGTFAAETTFATGAGSAPDEVAVADLNGDGKPDLIFNTTGNILGVLLGNGDGTFLAAQTLAAGSNPAAFAVADVNGDSSPDLVVANSGDGDVGVLLNDPPPAIVSITRTVAASVQASSVTFTVTFSEPVTGVTSSDFSLSTASSITSSAPSVSPSSGPASVYTVSVNNISGSGTLQLIAQNAGGIVNDAGESLSGFVNFTPQPLIGPAAQDIAVADVNGDGMPDMIVADLGNNDIAILLGNGDGTFQNPQTFPTGTNSRPYAVAVGDLNGDGKPDIVVAEKGADSIGVLLGNADGTFQAQQTYSTGTGSAPQAIELADVNGDGTPDIIVVEAGTNSVGVLLGNGNGTFQAQQTFAVGNQPISVAVADVNGDGKPDLIVANDNDQTVSVLLNTTTSAGAGFSAQQTFAAGGNDSVVLAADLNGDGLLDLVTCNPTQGNIAVLLGNGDGFQAPQTFAAPGVTSLSIADLNGDGRLDLVGNNFNDGIAVFLGNGNGTFEDEQTFSINTSPVAFVTTADINGDGRPDVIVADGANYTAGVVLTNLNGTEFDGPTYTILKQNAVFAVTGGEAFFDGNSHPATVTATGANGQDLSALAAVSYTNLADNTSSSIPPVQPGTYEVFASFSGNNSYNAIASFDTGQQIVINRRSSLQSVPSGRLPKATLIAGQKISPIHVNIRLTNAAATTTAGPVTVNVLFSANPGGTPTDHVVGTIARNVNVKSHKIVPFGAVTIRSLPAGLTGSLYILVKLTDSTGAINIISAGSISVAAPLSDLAAVSVIVPAQAKLGKKLTSTLTIIQDGNIPFTGNIPVELQLSTTNSTPNSSDIVLGPIGARLQIRPNRKGVLHLTATIPPTVPPGSYFLITTLDPNNTLGHTNPANNMAASVKKVAIN